MARARVIIADTDENYILSLQLKFIEEFFDKIDLEIITDQNYFNELFMSPQKAEIMIISENLYDPSLQKHNIGNVFVMVERMEEGQTADLSVNRVFKYSSIKEIYNEIMGKSAGILNVIQNVKKEPQIIVVTAASGGVGKTTVAMGLGAALAKNYQRVLYINTDRLQTFQYLLQNPAPISSGDVYSKLMQGGEYVYEDIKHVIRTEKFSYLPPIKSALMSLGISFEVYFRLIQEAKNSKNYDFIIVDTDSTFNEDKAKLMNMADKIMLITKQNGMSVFSTNVLVENINGVTSEKYFFICNDYRKEEEDALLSAQGSLKFVVNEYIDHMAEYDQSSCDDFANNKGFQKVAYLFL